jgi:hypothetical protein
VTIRLDQAGTTVDPREVVFAPGTATAYLRSDGASDVLEVVLISDPPDDRPTANDYRPVLSELGAGGLRRPRRPPLLASTPNTKGRRRDADTAEFVRIATPDPSTSCDGIEAAQAYPRSAARHSRLGLESTGLMRPRRRGRPGERRRSRL